MYLCDVFFEDVSTEQHIVEKGGLEQAPFAEGMGLTSA